MQQQTIPFRPIGSSGIRVSPVGLGCMGMSFAYGTFHGVTRISFELWQLFCPERAPRPDVSMPPELLPA
jgi:hypothetical protein